MPSFYIHLAVGKRYNEKNENKIKNLDDFYRGSLAPDFTDNKLLTHYGLKGTDDFIYNLSIKVLLNKYLDTNKVDTDYDLGIFLHLVADYIFYNYYLDKEYLKLLSPADFHKGLYRSYDVVNDYLLDKYNLRDIEYMTEIEPIVNGFVINDNTKFVNLIDPEQLDEFIEYVSSINLEEYRDKIIKADKNILP